MMSAIIPSLISLIGKTIDRAIPDRDQAEKLKQELTVAALQLDHAQLQSATSIIMAEAQGGSWLQRNWRPLLMVTIILIVFNNYVLYPYLSLFWDLAPLLDLPDHMWNLMKIGVGGYTVGRSAEKVMKHYSGGRETDKRNILGMRD